MAQRQKEKKPAVTDEESAEAGSEPEEGSEDALARVEDDSEDSPERDASDEGSSEKTPDDLAADGEGEARAQFAIVGEIGLEGLADAGEAIGAETGDVGHG